MPEAALERGLRIPPRTTADIGRGYCGCFGYYDCFGRFDYFGYF